MGDTGLRIYNHPVLTFRRGREVTIYFEDEPLKAYEGEALAAALYAAGHKILRYSPKHGRPRSVFCMIGKCGSCIVEVDGIAVRACQEPVREGMRVRRVRGHPVLKAVSSGSKPVEDVEVEALIVGGGPAGLAAAEVLGRHGVNTVIVDDSHKLGGQLIKQTHRFFGSKELFAGLRGFQIVEKYEKRITSLSSVRVLLRTTAVGVFKEGVFAVGEDRNYVIRAKTYLVATGAVENYLPFENNDLPGVMGAGAAQTLMNVWGVLPGRRPLIIGAGNVGLIVAYQLLQAGARPAAIVEAAPRVGGWFVHAAKVRRYGVPIYVRHTIIAAHGDGEVEAATIAEVDERWRPVPGTEKTIDCDAILLAVGLTPNVDLLRQFGAKTKYVPELGGLTALRTRYLETTVPGVFVAGDVAGVEEATTAIIEGWIAGYSMLIKLRGERDEWVKERERLLKLLAKYRSSPVSAKVRAGLEKVLIGGD